MFIGRVNNEPTSIQTNIKQLNPLISSALLLPIVDFKGATEITIPYAPPVELSMSHAFEHYSQFVMRGPTVSTRVLSIEWDGTMNYSLPEYGNDIYMKMDGLISALTYRKFKNSNIKIQPFIVAYSNEDHTDKIKWLKSIGIKDKVPSIIVNYKVDVSRVMHKYENWIACTIAGMKTNNIWIATPYPEISDYLPDRTMKLLTEGPDWLIKMYGRSIRVDIPYAQDRTRTDIVTENVKSKKVDKEFVVKSILCRCGKCIECYMNFIMLKNIGVNPSEVFETEKISKIMVDRIDKLIEFDKINKLLIADIKSAK